MSQIVEEKLNIPGDYQYKALGNSNYLQSNWHNNKLVVQEYLLRLNKKKRVLDIGTGSGNFEFKFHNIVEKIVGVDYNLNALNFIKEEIRKRGIKNIDLKKVDITDSQKLIGLGTFDVITMIDVIEHIDHMKAEKLVQTLYKLTNNNGLVCIVTPNYKSPWIIIEWILDKIGLVPKLDGEQHVSKYHWDSLNMLFAKNGFTVNKIATFNLVSWLIPGKNVSAYLARTEINSGVSWGNLLIGIYEKIS